MGRRMRTPLPQTNKQLIPDWPYLETFREKNKEFKKKQKANFDKRHRTLELSPIPDGTPVWITSENKPIEGTVLSSAGLPRSYVVDTPTGEVHRNRRHLKIIPNAVRSDKKNHPPRATPNIIITRARARQAGL